MENGSPQKKEINSSLNSKYHQAAPYSAALGIFIVGYALYGLITGEVYDIFCNGYRSFRHCPTNQKIVTGHNVIYLACTYIFVGICLSTPLFSKKLPQWLVVVCIAFVLSLVIGIIHIDYNWQH